MDCVSVYRENGRIDAVEFRNLKRAILWCWAAPKMLPKASSYMQTAFTRRAPYAKPSPFGRDVPERPPIPKITTNYTSCCAVSANTAIFYGSWARLVPSMRTPAVPSASLIRLGYVQGLMAGNALATHDLEASYLKTALGQNIYTQKPHFNGHYNHIDTINKVRSCGSIKTFLEQGYATDGILFECIQNDIPYVLAGSIRDDGPLPEVYADAYAAQDAMRNLVRQATTVICMASTLHTVATGNMTPSFRVRDGKVRPCYFYSVDISEFAVNKLRIAAVFRLKPSSPMCRILSCMSIAHWQNNKRRYKKSCG